MNDGIINGQVSIFDLPILDGVKSKKSKEENKNNLKCVNSKFDDIINLYSQSCSRIVKTMSGELLVELEDKTLYFNSSGINEFNLPINVGLMPREEIIVVNIDKQLNHIQKKKLEELKSKEYIKRKGDANIIIPGEKTIVVNPKGWVLEYEHKPIFKEDEIFKDYIKENMDNIEETYSLGDKVYINYCDIEEIGTITRIYNNGETLNVTWNGKQTAFYYMNVRKVKA